MKRTVNRGSVLSEASRNEAVGDGREKKLRNKCLIYVHILLLRSLKNSKTTDASME